MSLNNLKKKIEAKQAKLGVIGLGYVGFPVACTFAAAGFEVTGIDLQEARVSKINQGISPIEGNEPGLPELVARVTSEKKLTASTNYKDLANCDVVLIAVETPVDESNKPRYEALRAALKSLGSVMKSGVLVVIESTIAPATMAKVVTPLLEESSKEVGVDFYLGNCPERVMPGRLLSNLRNMSRVVGGSNPETAEVMVVLYRQIILEADLDPVDCITAELVKTAENAYRDVQIAFANEVALIAEATGGNIWKVRDLVNKSPDRAMLLPGAGVGGHCIPKDPWLLAYGVENTNVQLRLIPAARAVNNAMPAHVVELLTKRLGSLEGKKVLVLGYSYLEDSDDARNSPTDLLIKELRRLGASPVIHDPFIEEYKGDTLIKARGCDAAVLMVKHSEYKSLDLKALGVKLKSKVFIDGRGFFGQNELNQAGLVAEMLGIG